MSFCRDGMKLYPWVNGNLKVVLPTHELCGCVKFDRDVDAFVVNGWCRECEGSGVVEINGLPRCLNRLREERWCP